MARRSWLSVLLLSGSCLLGGCFSDAEAEKRPMLAGDIVGASLDEAAEGTEIDGKTLQMAIEALDGDGAEADRALTLLLNHPSNEGDARLRTLLLKGEPARRLQLLQTLESTRAKRFLPTLFFLLRSKTEDDLIRRLAAETACHLTTGKRLETLATERRLQEPATPQRGDF